MKTYTARELEQLLLADIPAAWAEEWDNVGLLVGDGRAPVRRVLAALEVTEAVIQEAQAVDAQLILTHHPVIFKGVKRLSPQDPQGELAFALARAGLSVISLHTNWDAAPGGTNDALAGVLGVSRLQPFSAGEAQPIGRVGQIIPSTLGAFAAHVKGALGSRHFLVVGDPARSVGRVALCGGEGSDFLLAARDQGADALVTGEMKYHTLLLAEQLGLAVVVAGHYETEAPGLAALIVHLQKRLDTVNYNRIEIMPSQRSRAPYWALA
ncbi:MAG: Nif3-like dinuclear metal center hexameric protein [Christensenellales bacterium]|jgi:dinuclear metal center YbgI/SA1388 family protein